MFSRSSKRTDSEQQKETDLAATLLRQRRLREDRASVATRRCSFVADHVEIVVAAKLLIVAADTSAAVLFAGCDICRFVLYW